jgi:hypothetical protein
MRFSPDVTWSDWPPGKPPILVESLEPDGRVGMGARVRVTDGDATWTGTVTVYEGAALGFDLDTEPGS